MIGSNGVARCGGRINDGNRTSCCRNSRRPARYDYHAFDATLYQSVDRLGLGGNVSPGVGNQHAVAGSAGGEFDGLRELGEKRVSNIRQYKAKDAATTGAQRASSLARNIAEFGCMFLDPLRQLLGNTALA